MDSSLSKVENVKTKDKHEQILLEPYKYISQTKGQQIHIQLIEAFNFWLKIPDEKQQIVSEVVQMLQNASLIVDDIEDNSKLRRGIPATHSIFGVAKAINAANYVYLLGIEKLFLLEKFEETFRIFTEHSLEVHRGQGMDIYWRDAVICPTEEEYKLMAYRKTGALFGLAVKLMQLFSTNKSDLDNLVKLLGIYFQIRNDYANLCSKEKEANKSYCEDITEGKFSFPLIHAIRSNPDDNQVFFILRQKTTDNDIKKYCLQYLEKVGSFEYTRKVLSELEYKLLQNMEFLGQNPKFIAIIKELSKIYSALEDCYK
uniref:Geranylgeranyl pyrophosphate synthase n=1 Tax=Biomphalaria glabrata TaxID=6526 RepID=A0A2C9JG79_BIOGL